MGVHLLGIMALEFGSTVHVLRAFNVSVIAMQTNLPERRTCCTQSNSQAMNCGELQRQGHSCFVIEYGFVLFVMLKEKPNERDVLLTRLPLRGGREVDKTEGTSEILCVFFSMLEAHHESCGL